MFVLKYIHLNMEVDNVIRDYIKTKDVDYAIMINGPWGAGKSFYWRNNLVPLIENIAYQETREEKICYKPLYISLFGVNSIDGLLQRIFSEINPFLKNKATKISGVLFNKALSFFNISKIENEEIGTVLSTLTISPKYIFCFDDLERISSSLLLDFLGFVSSLVEQDKIKVIIICNEDELAKNSDTFKAYKEKIVRHTHEFKPNFSVILDSMINPIEETYRSFLKQKRYYIVEMYDKGQCRNLRTLKFNIDIFLRVYNQIEKTVNSSFKGLLLDYFFHLSIIYSIEYKLGLENELFKQLYEITKNSNWALDFDWDKCIISKDSKEEKKNDKVDNYRKSINDKYFSDNYIRYGASLGLYTYILTGYYNDELIANDITIILESINKEKLTQEQTYLRKLINCWDTEDDELKRIVDDVIRSAPNGDFQLESYTQFFASLVVLSENCFIECNLEKVCSIFLEGIDKCRNNVKYDPTLNLLLTTFNNTNAYYKKIEKRVQEINEDLRLAEERETIQSILSDSGWYNKLLDFAKCDRPLFVDVDANKFLKAFLECKNIDKKNVLYFFDERYKNNHLKKELLIEENDFLKDLNELLDQYLKSHKNIGVVYNYVKHILDVINEVV